MDRLLKNLPLPLVASYERRTSLDPIDSISQLLLIIVGRNVLAERILSIKLLMGFVYRIFIQRVVVKPQLFFAWAKKVAPRLIVHAYR